MYITASSTISFQPTFQNKGFSSLLSPLNDGSELIAPDYSAYIPAMDRRRMSDVLRMSIACAIDCVRQSKITQPEGIIIGTSMGCPKHTKAFLDKIITANEGPVSPTSFIVSTHNTIAGQISLILKNRGYNITHTQNSLSFEQSLADAMLCVNEGLHHVLVGGADELEDAIYNTKARLNAEDIMLTCGASFFMLSDQRTNDTSVRLIDVGCFGLVDDLGAALRQFLSLNNVLIEEINLVLYSSSNQKRSEEMKTIFERTQMFDYQKMTGVYYTNPAFAMHYATDILHHKNHSLFGEGIEKVLVCNNLLPKNLGLILLDNKTN